MKVCFNKIDNQTFCSSKARHGAMKFRQVANKLYENAYKNIDNPPDIVQISTIMDNGEEVSAIINFVDKQYEGLYFLSDTRFSKSAFCKKIIEKFNMAVTKGKSNRK